MSSLQATLDESSGNLFMLPGMSSPEVEDLQLHIDSGGRVVRFDNECVLIPELNAKKQRPSMVITKSYSLPLWKKKGGSGQNQPLSDSDADAEEAAQTQTQRGSARSPSPAEDRLVIKVPIPTFRRRTSRSPTRGRSVSASPAVPSRLPSCLVHRGDVPSLAASTSSPSTSHLHPGLVNRRPSLPIYHRRRDDAGHIQTVPLRDCCQACETITEECMKLGESWQEKFSRGARRRRSASLDQQEATSIAKLASLHSRTASLGGYVGGGDSSSTSKLALTVDEVDKRRKSLDIQEHPPFFSYVSPSDTLPVHDKDVSASSTSTTGTTSTTPPAEDGLLADLSTAIPDILMGSPDRHRIYRSSPIQEEDDEAQLFPLPRRSPSGTPSPKISPAQSPNGSAVNLALPTEAGGRCSPSRRVSGSRESIVSSTSSASIRSNAQKISQKQSDSSQESFLKASLSRKPGTGVGMGYAGPNSSGRLSVPSTPSGSRNSSPTSKLAGSPVLTSRSQEKTALRISTTPPPVAAKTTQGRMPASTSSISVKNKGRDKPMPPLPASTSKPRNVQRPLPSPTLPTTPEDATLSITSSLPSLSTSPPSSSLSTPPTTESIASSSSPPLATPVSPRLSPTSPRSPGAVPSSPPSQSTMGRRKLSLTAPFLKAGGALRGVSADVLKGVSSFGGGF
ncbi:hypothetical protein CPB83DRAFT_895552 [Crepidotus variabilis]|uniref:Uncharacterized protein n=1 Tax=Crepidotus variabilis TaxID=179855 RepID=A0A9P6ECX0_9AGAR|nr:hypothetical protein CPB83DRAFT_895552 [Crepidotus variabilis]